MPAKYSHVKKRSTNAARKSAKSGGGGPLRLQSKDHRNPSPLLDRHLDRSISQAMTAVSQLERTIARILLLRFEQDMARLFSTHIHCVALRHLPMFVLRCMTIGGPGWPAANADCDGIKDYFRAAISMDLRQAGERVATKSVLWSYTALRHFALSHDVPVCPHRGLRSAHLLPHYDALEAHLAALEAAPIPSFTQPPRLGPLSAGWRTLEAACESGGGSAAEDPLWRAKAQEGYTRVCATLWRVAREFDVRGYGRVLREKLTGKWCDCGCSTDHLGEVCEQTVREDEEESGVRPGKEREWDGRGSGVYGWETDEEEDVWEVDFALAAEPDELEEGGHSDMTIGELMEWRYFRAEREKEQGNAAFKKANYEQAVERYLSAYSVEPEMPHYQLNLAAAYLKIKNFAKAERACDVALSQHRSVKGYWRRAQARKLQGRIEDAIKDLQAVLQIQPSNSEAAVELATLLPVAPNLPGSASPKYSSQPESSSSSSAYPSASSSSSSKFPARDTHLPKNRLAPTYEYAEHKLPKPLPFPKTQGDSCRLEISFLPLDIIVPVDFAVFLGKGNKGKKSTMPTSVPTKSETFSYPCWERYIVRKASD